MKTVLVLGSKGLLGTALNLSSLSSLEFYRFIFCDRSCGDLTKEEEVKNIFKHYNPNYVISVAANVGGIGYNLAKPADLFHDNILMNTHILHYAQQFGVEKCIMCSSICCMPDNIAILREDLLHDGPVYGANFAYGQAKRMISVYIEALEKQYNVTNYCAVIPGNLFGPFDNYRSHQSHVLPALISRLYLAKQKKEPFIVWGNGESRREFIYSLDAARFILRLLDLEKLPNRILISHEKEFTIKQMVEKLVKAANFEGQVIYDTSKPSGQHARKTDLSVLHSLIGNLEYTDMDEAVRVSYHYFEKHYPNVRI